MSVPIATMSAQTGRADGAADRGEDKHLLDKQKWLREWERWNYAGADENRRDPAGTDVARRELAGNRAGEPASPPAPRLPGGGETASGYEYEAQIALIQAGGAEAAASANGDFSLRRRSSARAQTPVTPPPPRENQPIPRRAAARDSLTIEHQGRLRRYLERNQYMAINIQVNTREKDVSLWLRDYRSGQSQRLQSILTDVKTLLRQSGHRLGKVWVNGHCLIHGA